MKNAKIKHDGDGTYWLMISADNGKMLASINLTEIAKERGPIVRKTLLKWAKENVKK